MIWSCTVDYSGWEDDIHHHHMLIEQDKKPTEQQVADHYNDNKFDQNEWECDERLISYYEDGETEWRAQELDEIGDDIAGYQAYIEIEPVENADIKKGVWL